MHSILRPILLVFLIFFIGRMDAQPFFISSCANETVCLSTGSCTQANYSVTTEAIGGCSPAALVYTWQLDLHNNISIDTLGSGNSWTGVLPKGTHRFVFKARDACILTATCEFLVTVKDCLPPNMTTISGIATPLSPGDSCRASVRVQDYIINYSDNCTPKPQIQLRFRKAGTGTGFPSDTILTYGRCEAGTNFLEIWAKDGDGNLNQNNVYILIQDPQLVCACDTAPPPPPPPPPPLTVTATGCVYWPDSTFFSLDYCISMTAPAPATPTICVQVDTHCYHISNAFPVGSTVSLAKDDFATYEVNLLDVLKIQRHILGLTPLPNALVIRAADVNNSGYITSSDIVELRKLILGAYSSFPLVPSFRFFSAKAYQDGKLEEFDKVRLNQLPKNDFFAIKMGNVDKFADLLQADDRSDAPAVITFADKVLAPGDEGVVTFFAPSELKTSGWQLSLNAESDQVQFEPIDTEQREFAFLQEAKEIRLISTYDGTERTLNSDQALFAMRYRSNANIRLSDALRLSTEVMKPIWVADRGKQIKPSPIELKPTAHTTDGALVFPNPVKQGNLVSINLAGRVMGEANWQIFNQLGQLVLSGSSITGIIAPLSGSDLLASGLYILQARTEAGSQTTRFVVD